VKNNDFKLSSDFFFVGIFEVIIEDVKLSRLENFVGLEIDFRTELSNSSFMLSNFISNAVFNFFLKKS